MASTQKTLERLHYLQSLYRRGYQSSLVDCSLEKLIALERAAAERELADLQARLQGFEARYHLQSEDFYQQFRAGQLGDAADFVEWSVFYDMWVAARERLESLKTEAA